MIEVSIQNSKILTGYTAEEKERIIAKLTYSNPQYIGALKHAPSKARYIKPYVNYYNDGYGYIEVPRGFDISFKHKIIEDARLENKDIDYPKFKLKLRKTQKEAFEAYNSKLSEKREHGVIILPTGKGKSVLGIYLACMKKQRCLVIVQKDDLIKNWKEDCMLTLGLRPKQVGLIKAGTFRLGKQITLTTIQTLSKLSDKEIGKLAKYFGMIICDEFHHSAAKTYEVINYFPARYRIGLTATAMRLDGLEGVLYHYFGGIAYKYEENVNDEDIMTGVARIKNVNIVKWEPKKRWDKELEGYVAEPIKPHDIKKAIAYSEDFNDILVRDIYSEYRKEKSCIVFCHEKNHCAVVYDMLEEIGIPVERMQVYTTKQTSNKQDFELRGIVNKDDMVKNAESKAVLITIATFAIATEGTNVKAWERGFLASTVANEKDTIQCVGRLRRRKEGKDDVIVYDYRFPKVKGAIRHGVYRDMAYRKMKFRTIKV